MLRVESTSAALVTHLPDIRYLTGFTGTNAALVVLSTPRSARLFTDGRYTAQARQEARGATVRTAPKSALIEACVYAAKSRAEACVFDGGHTTVSALAVMRRAVREAGRAAGFLKSMESPVAKLRLIKDADEVERMRRAAALTCELYRGLLSWIEVGMREIDVAVELEHRARAAGAERMSFETIVAAGERGSMPHARASAALLRPGHLVTVDFGIVLDGYCSDMTRTIVLGLTGQRVPARAKKRWLAQRTVFDAVLEAQEAAVSAVRAGVTCGDVDHAARSVLKRAGYGKYFSHSTGHGVGLEIHESPRVAKEGVQILQSGMIITIEPGVYLPGEFGIRIEDTVLVTENGAEILTPVYKGWTEL